MICCFSESATASSSRYDDDIGNDVDDDADDDDDDDVDRFVKCIIMIITYLYRVCVSCVYVCVYVRVLRVMIIRSDDDDCSYIEEQLFSACDMILLDLKYVFSFLICDICGLRCRVAAPSPLRSTT